jgi:hypothetical protein
LPAVNPGTCGQIVANDPMMISSSSHDISSPAKSRGKIMVGELQSKRKESLEWNIVEWLLFISRV